MKKFPLQIFLMGEAFSLVASLDNMHNLPDSLGMFLLFQLPILSIVAIVWLDRSML